MEPLVTAPALIEPPAHYPRMRDWEDVLEVKTEEAFQNTFYLDEGAAKTGLLVVGGSGSGKSRYLGRSLAWDNLNQRRPTVIYDPTGDIGSYLLDKIVRMPSPEREEWYLPYLLYIDAGSPDLIVPTPLLTRHSEQDRADEITDRILLVWEALDPHLETASVWGKNALEECGQYGGQIAVALGPQLDFVADLVRYPKQYEPLLAQIRRDYPELKDAVHYFQALSRASPSERDRKTEAFLRKAQMVLSNPAMRATFCAPYRGVDWHEVVRKGMTVVVDFRHEVDLRRRRFKLLWWLKDFIAFVKHRGLAGRDHEVTLMIDELTQLLGYQTVNGESVLAQDIEELVSVYGRKAGVNVVIALQEINQVDPRIQNALLRMGSLMVGRLAQPEDALIMAKALKTYDPEKMRKKEPVWMSVEKSVMGDRGWYSIRVPEVIDWRTIEYTANDQYILFADRLRNLSRGEFILKPSVAEGQMSDTLYTINVDDHPGEFPYEPYIAAFREQLRAGRPVDAVLQEIEQRKPPMQASPVKKKDKNKHLSLNGKIEKLPAHAGSNHSVPAAAPAPPHSPTTDPLPPTPTAATESGSDDVWQ